MTQRSTAHDALTREALRDEYAFCRTVGHAWEEIVANDLPKPESGWRFSVQCVRCHTHRHQIIDNRTGDSMSRNYDYPEDYQLDEKVTRAEMRLEWATRRNYDFVAAHRSKRKKASNNGK